MSSEPFVYVPLENPTEDGRLVTLHPSNSKDNIVCDLIDVKIDTMPRYEALSYMWGSKEPTQNILLNGKRKVIRENLWSALYHLRLTEQCRILWIDALCIDQESNEEKNGQVPQMGQIYGGASTVLVWLGPRDAESELAFTFIRKVAAEPETELEAFRWTRHGVYHQLGQSFFSKWVRPRAFGVFWTALNHLCWAQYWKRLWIIQEVGLACETEVYCGSDHIPGKSLYTVLARTHYSYEIIRSELSALRSAKFEGDSHMSQSEILQLEEDFTEIWEVLPYKLLKMSQPEREDLKHMRDICLAAQDSVCFDPRDKIFGLLGLAIDGPSHVDYSTTVFSLFEEVMLAQSRIDPEGKPVDPKKTPFDEGFAQSLQHSFAMSLSDKSVEEVHQMRHLFALPPVEGTDLLYTFGYLLGRIDSLEVAWPNGIVGSPAAHAPFWLQNLTESTQKDLRRTYNLQNQEVYEELQSKLDAVQAFHSPASYAEIRSSTPYIPPASGLSVCSNASPPRQRMLLKNDDCDTARLQVFHLDTSDCRFKTLEGRPAAQGVVPGNTLIGDVVCAMDISSLDLKRGGGGTVHFVVRWQGDRYRFVGRALAPHEVRGDMLIDNKIHLFMTTSVLQILTA